VISTTTASEPRRSLSPLSASYHLPSSHSTWVPSSSHTRASSTSFFPSPSGFSDAQFNGDGPHRQRTVIPPTSPPLTGTLGFYLHGGAGNVARQLLDLPNGLHFPRLGFSRSHETDLWWIVELVTICSHTLESLDVSSYRMFTHTCDRTDKLTLFKLARSQAHSASRRQQNSAILSFDL